MENFMNRKVFSKNYPAISDLADLNLCHVILFEKLTKNTIKLYSMNTKSLTFKPRMHIYCNAHLQSHAV